MGIHDPFDSSHAATVGPGGTLVAGTPFPPPSTPSDAGKTLIGTGDPAQPFVTPVELVALARKAGEKALCAMVAEAIEPTEQQPDGSKCIAVDDLFKIKPWSYAAHQLGAEIPGPWRAAVDVIMELSPAGREIAIDRLIELLNLISPTLTNIVNIVRQLTASNF